MDNKPPLTPPAYAVGSASTRDTSQPHPTVCTKRCDRDGNQAHCLLCHHDFPALGTCPCVTPSQTDRASEPPVSTPTAPYNSDERCELTELLKSECAHCRGLKTPEEEEKELDRDFYSSKWFD